MSLHKAEHIMVAVLSTLTGLTTTGVNIVRGRVYPFDVSVTDALTLTMSDDVPLSEDDQSYTTLDSYLSINVDIHVKSTSVQADTQLNLIRSEITVALMADHTQGGLTIDTIESGSEEPDLESSGAEVIAIQRVTYMFRYRRARTDPKI